MVHENIIRIYTAAAAAFDEQDPDWGVLRPFVDEYKEWMFENREHALVYRDAVAMDREYFGASGGYWRWSFDYPAKGGLLTFDR